MTGLLAAIPAASAHTPYGQWVTYRRKHLLIGCHRKMPNTYEQAKALVAEFEHLLPEASARVARAPHPQRLASLMGTDQLDLAILSLADAASLSRGVNGFEPYGEIPVGALALLPDDNVLIAREGFRIDHAWLISASAHKSDLVNTDLRLHSNLPWHEGAKAWRDGKAQPKVAN